MKSIKVYEGPAFTTPQQVHSTPYNREPYVRVQVPDLGQVDAMVPRWSPTHVLIVWEPAPGAARINAWVPAEGSSASRSRSRPGRTPTTSAAPGTTRACLPNRCAPRVKGAERDSSLMPMNACPCVKGAAQQEVGNHAEL